MAVIAEAILERCLNVITEAQVRGLGKFALLGFTLEHDGAMSVFLLHKGELVARFSQTGATEESLQGECAKHLVIKHSWKSCLWDKHRKD